MSLRYPIGERTIWELLCDRYYALIVRGVTVVDVDPRGRNCPIFLRNHLRAPRARWRRRHEEDKS